MSFIDGPMKPIKKLISAFQIDTQSSYCLEAGKMVDGLFVPNNLFTYGITTGKSELFVRKYEEIMGAYSWGRLNKKLILFTQVSIWKTVNRLSENLNNSNVF